MFDVLDIAVSQRLQPVNFHLDPTEILVLTGRSGVGKTVLLRALADLDPHEGEVKLHQQTQTETRPEVWRQWVMWFAAETAWWLEDIAAHFSTKICPNIDQAWLNSALEKLHLSPDILKKFPRECSTGEKQRLALLRGLIHQPQVLLLDEITANLDTETTQAVEQLIFDYVTEHQACAIWVTHDTAQQHRLQGVSPRPFYHLTTTHQTTQS